MGSQLMRLLIDGGACVVCVLLISKITSRPRREYPSGWQRFLAATILMVCLGILILLAFSSGLELA